MPAGSGRRKEVEGAPELSLSESGAVDVVAVGFVDDDSVGHFHDSAFDSLEFVAGSGELEQEEEVDHRVDGCLALPYADSLDEDVVESGCFAEYDRFAGLACDATEGAG